MTHTRNPEQEFRNPQRLVESDRLSATEKRKILESWQADLIELQKAEEENMPDGAEQPGETAQKLAAVTAAIAALGRPVD